MVELVTRACEYPFLIDLFLEVPYALSVKLDETGLDVLTQLPLDIVESSDFFRKRSLERGDVRVKLQGEHDQLMSSYKVGGTKI